MYFLEQLKKQIISSVIAYQSPLEANAWAEVVDNTQKAPMGPDDVRYLSTDAEQVTRNMQIRWAQLESTAAEIDGWEWNSELVWQEWNDMFWEWIEQGAEHPDSVWTASMEDIQDVADRNGMADVWDEEPILWEDGNEIQAEELNPEEITRRRLALESNRNSVQDRIDRFPEWSTEAQDAQREMSAIKMLLNILEYGSINPPSIDSEWNPVSHPGWSNSYGWWIGERYTGWISELSPEQAVVWHELASWLQQRWYPVFEWQPNYCGKNVWEAMNEFGYKGLPNHWRNGADWARICAERPNQFQQINCRPEDAPAGALISYERNSGWSTARQASGHIEIALWEWRGYYYGAVASQPGWSQKPPREWSYTIWMPTSKTA